MYKICSVLGAPTMDSWADGIHLARTNPCNRPTADEALRHPFFRSCFYIPPSLRFRDAASAGTNGESEQDCYKRYHGALSDSNLNHSFPSPNKLHAYSSTPVHPDLNRAKQFGVQPRLLPLKAGEQGIAESADMFIRPAQKFHPATIYTGKVAV
ncbi:hypothetical protein NC652_009678 [Populus alba x Populus x berolinensis]|nr:hypothetical protein NC652_009678 [Populus alba x Populus x berolinensis]